MTERAFPAVIGSPCRACTAAAMGSVTLDRSGNALGSGRKPAIPPAYALDGMAGQVASLPAGTNLRFPASDRVFAACGSLPVRPLEGFPRLPADPDGDCNHEDLNGNGRLDFAGAGLYCSRRSGSLAAGRSRPAAGSASGTRGRLSTGSGRGAVLHYLF